MTKKKKTTTDEQEYDVDVTRISWASMTIRVSAPSVMIAKTRALEAATDEDFGAGKDSEYEAGDVVEVSDERTRKAKSA